MHALDQLQLSFDPTMLAFINWMLALVMFGVALDLTPADFTRVLRRPRAPAVGLMCQFLLMPALATALLAVIQPPPSIALGILLIASCPGGNVSNFLTSLAGGHAAVSVSMSAISTLAAIVMTPLNFGFWSQVLPGTAALMREIHLAPLDIVSSVLVILILPSALGMLLAHRWPALARRLRRPMQVFSMLVLFGFIGGALSANWQVFMTWVGAAFWIVLLVNASGLALGYGLARAVRLPVADAKAVCFETGIQNSGFGLLLVFQFFGGLGGMAIIAAWWGIWHLLSGLTLALLWAAQRRRAARHRAVVAH